MTVGLDFDGVIHRYSKGWNGGGVYDPPMDGAVDAVKEIMAREAAFVFTARDIQEVCVALESWGLKCRADLLSGSRRFWNQKGVLLVTNRKYAARLYLDDRAVTFSPHGGWDQAMADLGFRDNLSEPELTAEQRVRALHRKDALGECGHCTGLTAYQSSGVMYPCPTIRALG